MADEFDAPIAKADGSGVSFVKLIEWGGRIVEPLSSLRPKIGHVYGMRPEEEMLGIHTTALVTTMTNVQSLGDRAVLDDPGQPMSEEFPAFDGNVPIAPLVQVALPYQTT